MDGWYYLHTNGDLIYKNDFPGVAADIRESPFAIALWPLDTTDRACAWGILVEAQSAGANPERIMDLVDKWGCTDEDGKHYAEYLSLSLGRDGDRWCVHRSDFEDLQSSPCGFGSTVLEAMSDLCKQLGYKPQKMWGASFKDLCMKEAA